MATLEEGDHVWAIVPDATGRSLYVGTGPNGKLFEVDAASGKAKLLWDSGKKHLLSVVRDKDSLLVGASDDAELYRIEPKTGAVRALADELRDRGLEVVEALSCEDGLANVLSDAAIHCVFINWTLGRNDRRSHREATELMRTLFGVTPALSGRVLVEGKEVRIRKPRQAIESGIYLVPEDRKLDGLVLTLGVDQNISLPGIRSYHPWKLLLREKEREVARRQVEELGIKTPRLSQKAINLSGGNQQKVVFGRWLVAGARILVLDDPTVGVDVGAKEEIYRIIAELTSDGTSVIFLSSELPEVIGLADRMLILREGAVAGELAGEEMTEARALALALGEAA